jgi:type I restriction enzyme S subunit
MSSEWRRTTIEEIAADESSSISIGPFGSRMKSACYVDSGVPVVRGNNISGGKYPEGHFVFITEEKASELKSSQVRYGDLVFPHRGAIGKVALIPENGRMILSSSLMKLTPSREKCCPAFLLYFFRSRKGVQELLKNASTVGTPGIGQPLTSLKQISLDLPPLGEQKAIAHILGTLDDKIELNRKTNETLEAMAEALFKSWFVDFDPVRAKVESRPTGLPAEISDLFPDSFEDSELGEIPSGWRVAPVGDVVECVGGSTPSTNEPEYWDGGEYFWATPKDLSSLSEPFLLDTAKKITADGVQRISSGILPVGTVLLSSRAPVGYVAAACVPVSINQGFIALKSNGLMSSAYLLNWCLSNVQQFKDRASGTTFAEISKAAFRPIPLLVPSEQVARSFSDKAQALYERVVSNMRQSTLLAATRDSLLPQLISGEIRIPDAEKMLEEVGI